jgi:hypothetical protein
VTLEDDLRDSVAGAFAAYDSEAPSKKPRAKKVPEPVTAPEPWQPTNEERARIVPLTYDIEAIRRAPVRHSNLKNIARSPLHYLDRLLRPSKRTPETDTGTIAHFLIFGSGPEIVVFPGKVRNGKAWEAFHAEHAGKLIVTKTTYLAAAAIAAAVRRDREAMKLLDGQRETELKPWLHGTRLCGGRPDVVSDEWIVELKTSTSAEPFWFTRNGIRLAYPSQLAFYREGKEHEDGKRRRCAIVVAEMSSPNPVQIMPLTDQALSVGDKNIGAWMNVLQVCEESDCWPAYDPSTFDVPDYAAEDDEDEELVGFGDDEEAAA